MMIMLRNLTLGTGSSSADAMSLTVHEGEIVSVAGLSDADRRRLFSVLALQAEDWSGEYELFGYQVHKLDDELRADLRGELVGTMLRSTPLVECLTVEENLEIPLSYRRIAAAERSEMINSALSRLGVASIRDKEVDALPTDQRQLVGIAKALVSNPRLVLLEEPAQHLNPLQLRLVSRELARLRAEKRVVIQSVDHVESGVEVDRVVEFRVSATGRRTAGRLKHSRDRISGVVGLC